MDLAEFLVTLLLPFLAVAYAAPRQMQALRKAGIYLPMPDIAAVLQGIVLCAIGAGLGIGLRGYTGFDLFDSPGSIGGWLIATGLGIVGHLFFYYVVFRPRLPRGSTRLSEQIRLTMGLPARLLQGGLAEEVQFRWGFLSLVAATASLIFKTQGVARAATAIAISALVFGFFHLIGARQIGLGSTRMESIMVVSLNFWGGAIFGWVFWQYGLIAAMLSHALFHLAWFPIEKQIYERG